MKLLKGLLVWVVVLALVYAVGGFLLPSSTHVERSVVIQRPPADVFALLNAYPRFNEWSPWYEREPTARYDYSGPASGVGSTMTWEGEHVGKGRQSITESVPNQRIVVALDFDGQPASATYVLTPDGTSGTRVTWSFDSVHGHDLTARWFGLLFEKMVGGDYEKGLAKLKAVLENEPNEHPLS